MTNNRSTTKDVRTCSLRSQIFFTVKMANRQESKTRITQLHNHIFIYNSIKDVNIDDAKVSSSANMETFWWKGRLEIFELWPLASCLLPLPLVDAVVNSCGKQGILSNLASFNSCPPLLLHHLLLLLRQLDLHHLHHRLLQPLQVLWVSLDK